MIDAESQAAVAALFRAEAENLFAFAWAALTQGAAETAQDLVQQTFQAAILAWAEVRERSAEGQRRWLYQVLKNKAIDDWRKQRRICPADAVEVESPSMSKAQMSAARCCARRRCRSAGTSSQKCRPIAPTWRSCTGRRTGPPARSPRIGASCRAWCAGIYARHNGVPAIRRP